MAPSDSQLDALKHIPRLKEKTPAPDGLAALLSVGNVSDMLIHDVRNLLSVISMQSQLVLNTSQLDSRSSERLLEVVRQVEQIDKLLGTQLRVAGFSPRYREGFTGLLQELEALLKGLYDSHHPVIHVRPEREFPLRPAERSLLHHLVLQVLHFLVHHDQGKSPLEITFAFPESSDKELEGILLEVEWSLACADFPAEVLASEDGITFNERAKAALSLALPRQLARELGGSVEARKEAERALVRCRLKLNPLESEGP